MKVGDVARFYDYDYAGATGEDRWRIGVVVKIWHPTWEEVRDQNLVNNQTWAIMAHDNKTQPIIIPSKEREGTWIEVISES